MAKYKVAGYVKLAKLWEKKRRSALAYHQSYYQEKYDLQPDYALVDVFVDITGKKEIRNRPQMLRLIRSCLNGEVNCISTQTKAYLAANSREFCYLIKLLFSFDSLIEIVTEDMNYYMDTIVEPSQRVTLSKMADDYAALNENDYLAWKLSVLSEISILED